LHPLLSSNVAVTPLLSLGPPPDDSQKGPETLPLLESLLNLTAIGSLEKGLQPAQGEPALEAVRVSRAEAPGMDSKSSETEAQRPKNIIELASSEQLRTREEEGGFRADKKASRSAARLLILISDLPVQAA
jgi:hypothetical protein